LPAISHVAAVMDAIGVFCTIPNACDTAAGVHRVSTATANGYYRIRQRTLVRYPLGAVSKLPKLFVAGSNPVARSNAKILEAGVTPVTVPEHPRYDIGTSD